MKKYLISGIPPSHGGVGYLMYILVELAVTNRYEVVMPKRVNKSVKKSFNNTCNLLKEFYKRKRTVSSFKKEISTIKNSEIILIHPQTIGYKLLKLSSSTSVASREIEIFFKEKLSLKKESSIWIKYFFSDYCNLNLLYEEVIYG